MHECMFFVVSNLKTSQIRFLVPFSRSRWIRVKQKLKEIMLPINQLQLCKSDIFS